MANKQPWPPEKWQAKYRKFSEHSAWYSGSRNKLMQHYSIKGDPTDGAGDFWGQNLKPNQSKTMVHVPVAGDIAGVSADLVLGAHPDFQIPEAHQEEAESGAKDEQDRLNEIVKKTDMYSRLVEASEVAASLGGSFLKVNWKTEFKDFPVLSVAHPDHAIPYWKWGFLQKVIFHKVVKKDRRDVYRHLEIHEPGVIRNELYLGRDNELGSSIELARLPETEDLEEEIQTGVDEILCAYMPNKLPNRLWRTSNLGQSDYQGVEDLMDSLDQVYSDWMHEIEIARGRIIASEEYLKNAQGEWMFDMDQDVFSPISEVPGDGSGINPIQFEIRSQKYQETAIELFDRIVTAAGYSPQSFGLSIDGRAESGTALKLRTAKSERTREKKQNYHKRAIEKALKLLMKIDAEHFEGSAEYDVAVEFDNMTEVDMKSTADAIKALDMAGAISDEVKVRMQHPDWEEDQIREEIDRIQGEKGVKVNAPDNRV